MDDEEDTVDTVRRLGTIVARLRDLASHAARRAEGVVGLPARQVAALRAIDDGATSVSGVAERSLTHVSNASRTVDALVGSGLVDRAEDPDDRRAVVLSLTADGRTRLTQLDRHRDEMLHRALAGLTTREGRDLVGLMERFVDGLEPALREQAATDEDDAAT